MRKVSLRLISGLLLAALLGGCVAPAGGQITTPGAIAGNTPVAPATAAASGAGSGPGRPLTKITLAMGYIPSVQFAPFYVAQARGYFRDAGLEVTFNYGTETDLLKLVGTNELQYMIGSGEEVILARSQGLPVRYVMRFYRRFPVVVFAKSSSGIRTAKDLEGKKVGTVGLYGATYVGWEALVYAAHIDTSKVTLLSIGYTQASAVERGQVDAATDYIVNGPVQLRLAGQDVTVIPVADYIDLPSNGIITNDQTIKDHPEVVQALVRATLHGLADTLADPDAAFQISLQAVPEAGGDQAKVNRAIFDESLKLWQADPGQLGVSDPAAWATAATFMRKMGLIDKDVAPGDLYTNQFVTQ